MKIFVFVLALFAIHSVDAGCAAHECLTPAGKCVPSKSYIVHDGKCTKKTATVTALSGIPKKKR